MQPCGVVALDSRPSVRPATASERVCRSPNVEFMSGPIIGTTAAAATAATSLGSGMLSSSDGAPLPDGYRRRVAAEVMGVNWMSVRERIFIAYFFASDRNLMRYPERRARSAAVQPVHQLLHALDLTVRRVLGGGGCGGSWGRGRGSH